jgi:hypothetical protein
MFAAVRLLVPANDTVALRPRGAIGARLRLRSRFGHTFWLLGVYRSDTSASGTQSSSFVLS